MKRYVKSGSYKDQYSDFDGQLDYEVTDFCKEVWDAYYEENQNVTEEGFISECEYFLDCDDYDLPEAMTRCIAQEGLEVVWNEVQETAHNLYMQWWRSLPY